MMHQTEWAVILAGGDGTRLNPPLWPERLAVIKVDGVMSRLWVTNAVYSLRLSAVRYHSFS